MVWNKIDSSVSRLWLTLMEALVRLFEWMNNSKARPSALKSFTATTEGTST
jgi:hypothetical protein